MKTFNKEEYKNVAIHCATEEEYNRIIDIVKLPKTFREYWKIYKEDTLLYVGRDTYGALRMKMSDIKTEEAADFIKQYTIDENNWCVFNPEGSRLPQDIVDYINNRGGCEFNGNSTGLYYGMKERKGYTAASSWGTQLTIEECRKYILKTSDVKKYTIEDFKNQKIAVVCTPEQKKQLYKAAGIGTYNSLKKTTICAVNGRGNASFNENTEEGIDWYKNNGYTIIEFNQIQIETNMEKKIVGYKLIKEYPGFKIGDEFEIEGEHSIVLKGYKNKTPRKAYYSVYEDQYKDSGFFQPIYEELLKEGEWIYILDSGACINCDLQKGDVVQVKSVEYTNNGDKDVNAVLNKGKFRIDGAKMGNSSIKDYHYFRQYWRKATKEEIENASSITIKGYKMEVMAGEAKFGCQEISKQEIVNLDKLMNRGELQMKISILGEDVPHDKIKKILARL